MQGAQQSVASAYATLDRMTAGNARSVVFLVIAIIVFYIYDYFFG